MAIDVKLGMLIQPVEDLEAALSFYQEAFGFALKFRDGDRFCALDAGGVTIALAAGAERVADTTAISYRVGDVAAAVGQLKEAGAEQIGPISEGPHERRAVLRDPAGNPLILYAPK